MSQISGNVVLVEQHDLKTTEGEHMADQASPRWSADSIAVFEDGTKVSTNNSCFHCNYALLYCYCHIVGRTPQALHPDGKQGYVDIKIKGGML